MVVLTGVRKVTAFHAIRDAIRRGYGFEDIRAALLGPDEEREPVRPGGKLARRGDGWPHSRIAAWPGIGFRRQATTGRGSCRSSPTWRSVSFRSVSADGRRPKLTAPTADGPGFWNRLWAGRLGRWTMKLAGGREQRALPAANEPTEVALGRAADALFAALPAAEQRRLIEVPALIRQLEGDVQALPAAGGGAHQGARRGGGAARRGARPGSGAAARGAPNWRRRSPRWRTCG